MRSEVLPRVLITNRVPSTVLAPLDGLAQVIMGPDGGDLMPRKDVLELAPSLDAIINQAELRVDAELLDVAPRLKIVANVSIGVNNLDLLLLQRRGIWVTNAPDAFTDSTADCTLGLILAVARRLVEAHDYVSSGKWKGFQPGAWDGSLLSGKVLGIVGYGKIGEAVEKRARAFGMTVVHTRRTPSKAADFRSLDDLLRESDFVSLHIPLNSDSDRLLGASRLALMKRGAILINMARGRVVDEQALVDALLAGHLGGAGLDVFEDEPNVHASLRGMRQVVPTPHLGGGTRESRFAARLLCVRNVAAVLKGEPPLNPLTLGAT